MRDIAGQEEVLQPEGALDLAPYVDAIPAEDLDGHKLLGNDIVEHAYRSGDNAYDHVMFPCEKKNIYLVVVVRLSPDSPYGHHLLNLDREYGFD